LAGFFVSQNMQLLLNSLTLVVSIKHNKIMNMFMEHILKQMWCNTNKKL